ncbi:LemA family protein [Marinobacter salexigens]|uniref:LemA family protein n=1 Tax=Marinobacter salexigens TaxID=1925763 RepID=UPI000C283236|nr:LemA family protein [Marinobacter salexigens]
MELLLLALAGLVVLAVPVYNGIVNRKNAVQSAWASVLVQERQKMKILPALEKAVSEYSEFEKGLLTQITQLREHLNGLEEEAPNTDRLNQSEALTNEIMKSVNLTVEAYPDLKSEGLVRNMMQEISEQQEQIGAALRLFNSNVQIFNSYIQNFPNNLVNSILNKEPPVRVFTDSKAASNFEYRPNL